jgi:Protein of unknown function (DUF1553)/Protein of unknown function (DUF1549)/Planctomycete cytochrome C
MATLEYRVNAMRKFLVACFTVLAVAPWASAEGKVDFNRDIRPLLAENCFYCHGQDASKRKAGLRLDERKAAIDAGAIVPNNAAMSDLVQRIDADDPGTRMPPPKSNRKLSDAQKKLLKQWIEEGAEYQVHWTFVAPVRPALPQVKRKGWARTPIDVFVLEKLESAGLKPSPEADRVTLIRRLALDLTGIPPTPQEVDAFVADRDDKAYEKLVDRLLASKHYGERLALPWLDAARYADSNGFQQDGDTWQWIWRDWVVKALNDDLPFDQFTIWQLAGDLLPDATVEQKIASGFNRNHLLNGEGGAIPEEQRFVNLFDRMDTTATTWLGLTMACAQCHDHKYDPITMRDYYSLLDAFNRVPETGRPQRFSARVRVSPPLIELPTEENKTRIRDLETQLAAAETTGKEMVAKAFGDWRAKVLEDGKAAERKGLPAPLSAILGKPEKERTDADKKTLTAGLKKHFDDKVRPELAGKMPAIGRMDKLKKQLTDYKNDQIPRAMIMSDEKPRETHILDRGEYLNPKEKVTFATPAFLPPLPQGAPPNRLGFARWLVAPEQPLTARVQVNRMWQHFFGTGIVKTSEDLGVQGEYPVHGKLLDWLAVEFRERGWSMKAMHRLIVTSATYRQSSKMTAEHRARDPENRLLARASRFRMPSMILRDLALASSGLLEPRIGGGPVYPYQPEDVWEGLAVTKERDFTYPISSGKDLYRRSLYTFWRRTVIPANMFDASSRETCRVKQSTTSTPLHALTTLNDPTWVEAARTLAEKTMKASQDLDQRLADAFRRVVCRKPGENDLKILRRAYERQLAVYKADAKGAKAFLSVGASKRDETLDLTEHAAMTAVCLAILNLDEALTRE